MKKQSVRINTLLFFFSIFTILIEFGSFYLLEQTYLSFLIAGAALIILNHIALEMAISYEANFIYSTFLIVESFLIVLILYYYKDNPILGYDENLWFFLLLNWGTPILYCICRNLADKGPRYLQFNLFFRNMSIVFLILYILLGVQIFFLEPLSLRSLSDPDSPYSLLPFWNVASHIEAAYYNIHALDELFTFTIKYILYFIPFGFYIRLTLRNLMFPIRALCFLLVPIGIEIAQYFLEIGRCDTSDIFIAAIGGGLGAIVYQILNSLYRSKKDHDFMVHYSGYRSLMQKYF